MSYRIPFNRPYIAGKELFYIARAVTNGQIAADGEYTRLCEQFFQERFGICRALLAPSCTAALEMAATLCDLGPGDEVIMPSYTFVSTASAVVRCGATPVFVDIREDTLNLNEALIEDAITDRTRVILPVHYAGVACEMGSIMETADKHGLRVIEDAAQGVNAYYGDQALGSIGHLGTYSFHETKNYVCGEGGALCINDPDLVQRAEILRDKGTNRQAFFRGEADKYTWIDVGSSYVLSEVSAAFLWAQLEALQTISDRRAAIYERYLMYFGALEQQGLVRLPRVPDNCRHNHHMFYLLLPNMELRDRLMAYLRTEGILSVFHYVPLHSSPAGVKYGREAAPLPLTDDLSGRLLRLPFYFQFTTEEQDEVMERVTHFLTTGA